MTTSTPLRLDVALVRRGLARSRRRAAELVVEGRVSVAGSPARKPSQAVTEADDLQLAAEQRPDYVSRGAHKLAGALGALERLAAGAVDPAGAWCLDAGASTGGFTQVLLERGAAHVTAIDVGHGQLSATVAQHPAVTPVEGLNVRDLRPAHLDRPVSLVVADLSFISLTLAVGPLVGVCTPGAHLLLMVKPQFEVGRARLGAGGVVTSPDLRRNAVLDVARSAVAVGAAVRAVVPSPLPGPSGNHEYFLWLVAPGTDAATSGALGASGNPLQAVVHDAVVHGRAGLVAGTVA